VHRDVHRVTVAPLTAQEGVADADVEDHVARRRPIVRRLRSASKTALRSRLGAYAPT
jgi:hypothetical protein